MTHIDDHQRIGTYRQLLAMPTAPDAAALDNETRRLLRMLIGSISNLRNSAGLAEGIAQLWQHPQVRAELLELLDLLERQVDHLHTPLGIPGVPLQVHARYSRTEILAAFDIGKGLKGSWQTGVLWEQDSQTDLFAFTLDKSKGSFSPSTRYRDYAISPELIHWESQSITRVDGETGQRYLAQATSGTNVALFARLTTSDTFWCLGTANYVSHEGERPIAITWRLDHRLPGDLYASFAAAVA